MRLEVRIPISPRPAWLNRVRLIAKAVRQWYPDALVTVSVSPEPCIHPSGQEFTWVADIGAEWSFVPKEDAAAWAGTRSEYLATMMDRYKPPFYGDHILMLDADVFPIRRFDWMLQGDAIHGVMAHHAPYGAIGWRRLFQDWGLPPPRMEHEYSGWGIMERRSEERFGPFYPNSGMICGPRHLFERLSEPFFEALDFLRANISDTYWFDQVGFALGMASAGICYNVQPLRCNFPNRPAFDAAHPGELANVVFLHAMQTDVIDRDRDFESEDAMRALVARQDLTGSNEVVRQWVEKLL